MEVKIKGIEEELAANLAKQKGLEAKVEHLMDRQASDAEIDASAKLVANETESKAMAGMLGNMWKEMRMFEVPFYAKHVDDEVHELKHEQKALEKKLTADQAALSKARKKWAAEAKAKKAAKEKAKEEAAAKE